MMVIFQGCSVVALESSMQTLENSRKHWLDRRDVSSAVGGFNGV